MVSMSLCLSSSFIPSPIPYTKFPTAEDPIFRVTRFSVSAPLKTSVSASSTRKPAPATKTRNPKDKEFSQTLFFECMEKTPIKKKKKKKEKRKSEKVWVHTLPEVLYYHIHKKNWAITLELFGMLRGQPYYQPREDTYMRLIVLLGKSGQPHRANELFSSIHEDGCESTELYTALIAAYCRNNLVDEALSILDEMMNIPNCQPDIITYSTLMEALADSLKFETVELVYDKMIERSIMPITLTQNLLLSCYGKAGKFDQMEKIVSSMMESTTCKPDVWTMNAVISVFRDEGQIDMMEKWYEKFCSFGIQRQRSTFNILMGAYSKKRMYDKMSSVMQCMRKENCPWTTPTYNFVIEAFADVGDAANMERAYDQMVAEGLKADTKTFCCLINGYAKAGIFYKVMSSVVLAEKLQIHMNTSFYNAVISACAKEDSLIEMERFFKRMKEKECQPDDTTYSVMIEAYGKANMNDKIYYLEQEKQMMISDEKKLNEPQETIFD
ncbi:pentatricopeptide repeat-containing protein At3g06430, chloroplastic [Vigna radiata var. radiata]|uniref:Pentatricopeptide repeat-containing protein At3g06430, chloroplastic n=1 Tax=Vigna radiata var. radiata TaxID=3916 RepID=A0A1S3U1I3_VIGRR|nr:pentatricopeptide repeat-containing protein At3g06430, chloroplastic [Vigna radiata var. radiata]XP_022636196.1 pentatricopeptide repeat-containing protein At3g06430, chloroplastic [Vigna radiata var. radiata]